MTIQEARLSFIQTWGALGSAWGIPRSMAQIHALLLTTPEDLSTEEVMDAVQLSRGNVNINMRELINWNLVKKQNKLGERKEFFAADKNIWSVAQSIVTERKRRELIPIHDMIKELKQTKIKGPEAEVAHFLTLINDLEEFVVQMDKLSEMAVKLNKNVLFKNMMKMFS